jgi:aminoglycoside phosphotransferase (APT) family kinase protein
LQAKLHQLDYEALGLGSLGQAEGYTQRQVQGWSKRYRAARTDDAPDCEGIIEWLSAAVHKLPASRGALIHNDYKLDNIVFDPQDLCRVKAILDWEMTTIGDPLMDLGNSLAYWVEPGDPSSMKAFRTLPSLSPGYLTRKEQLAFYQELTGTPLDHWNFYATFGLFRLAVIAQQIYQRYVTGYSQDPRFGAMIHGVKALEQACLKNIDS